LKTSRKICYHVCIVRRTGVQGRITISKFIDVIHSFELRIQPNIQKGFAMNIFNTILQKLGIQKPAEAAKPATNAPATNAPSTFTPTAAFDPKGSASTPAAGFSTPQTGSHTPPANVPMVDVMSKLEKLSGNSGLDWKVSIVDLLKLLDIDSSLDARKQLATELSCPADLMGDSAKMNTWLHKTVLQKIAENGGNIPASLLH